MRSLQGLIFIAVALFALKWEFVAQHVGKGYFTIDTLPPLQPWMVFLEAGVLAAIGLYLLVSGEITSWRKSGRAATRTFLAGASAFLLVFSHKWTYSPSEHILGYLPPFTEENLGLVVVPLLALTIYFLIRGEIEFWSKGDCEQHARQVSSEAAPSASPDEPSA